MLTSAAEIPKVGFNEMLTNVHIKCHEDSRTILARVHSALPLHPFDPKWKGATGYFDGLSRQLDFDCGTGFASIDDNGRRLVVLPGEYGPMIYFDRFGDHTGPVVCNGHMADLAPSWSAVGNTNSGWCADTDQVMEPLIRQLR
ncbi:hypothetical protein [Xanthomonas phage RTH11]|nr:hypothetical protein [Xanthomonas phage RTH11]